MYSTWANHSSQTSICLCGSGNSTETPVSSPTAHAYRDIRAQRCSGKSTDCQTNLVGLCNSSMRWEFSSVDPQGEFAKGINERPRRLSQLVCASGWQDAKPTDYQHTTYDTIVLHRWDLVEALLAESSFIAEAGITTPGPMNPKESARSKYFIGSSESSCFTLSDLQGRAAGRYWDARLFQPQCNSNDCTVRRALTIVLETDAGVV